MKKILLIVSVALLIGAMLVVSCSATNYQFTIDNVIITSFNDLSEGSDLWAKGVVTYIFDNPWYDGANGASIKKVVIDFTHDSLYYTVGLYDENDRHLGLADTPDITSSIGLVNVATSNGDIDYTQVLDMFFAVFGTGLTVGRPGIMESLLPNIGSVLSWIPGIFIGLIAIFWTGSALTPLGYLAVAGLSISVILLIVYLISRFLKFRG